MIAIPLGAVGLPDVKRWTKKNSPSSHVNLVRPPRPATGGEVASLEGNLHLPLPTERV
jgi:hypothetical protein